MRFQAESPVSRHWVGLIGLLLVFILSGCNSSGGGVAPPADAPVLSLTPQAIKTFRFSWDDGDGETEYRLLEDPDGISGYTEIASLAADTETHDHVVFLPARINARYLLQACNAGGCADSAPVNVAGTLAEAVGYVKATNTGADDRFGSSIALSADGDTLAIGADLEDSNATGIGGDQNDNTASTSGAVYVFTRAGASWTQQAYIKASNTEAVDQFGWSVALSADGDTLVVGAIGEDSNATGIGGDQNDNSASNSGAVYVFTRTNTAWTQQAYVKASNAGAGDRFGWSVALSVDGDTLAVGAFNEESNATGIGGDQNDNSASNSGAVYVFTRTGADWTQQAYIKASNTDAGDQFGYSVALSAVGDTLAVGAYLEDSNATGIGGDQNDNTASASGAVYVFIRTDTAWTQQAYIKASNTGAGDNFGYRVALSVDGDTLAVGASSEESNATGIGGDQDDNTASASGAAYVFTRAGASWTQQAYIKASNTGAGDRFGWSVALSADGDTLAVGAISEESNSTGIGDDQNDNSASNSGAVYVFTRAGASWTQQAYIKASNTDAGDQFGYRVALSADGDTLAVGAIGEDSNATGIGSDQANNAASDSGAVYLY